MRYRDNLARLSVYVLLVAGLADEIFLVPSSIAPMLLYMIAVLVSFWTTSSIPIAAGATVLAVLGPMVSRGSEPMWMVFFNRSLLLAVLWVIVALRQRSAAFAQAGRSRSREMLDTDSPPRSDIHESEEWIETILESTPDAIIWTDENGDITMVNQQAEKLFSYSRKELLGQPVELLVPERFRGAHVRYRGDYMANPTVRPIRSSLDLWGRKKNGNEFPAEIMLTPFRTERGLSVVSVVRDITERRTIELSLRENEQRFRELTENMTGVVYLTNLEKNRFLYLSPRFEELFGMSRAEAYADYLAPLAVIHPDDRASILAAMKNQRDGEAFIELNYRLLRPDGSTRWVSDRTFPIRDAEGKVLRYAGIFRDVTREVEAENALRESEQRFREVMENIQDVVFVSNVAKDRFLYLNARFEEFFGMPRSEAYENYLAPMSRVHPDDRPLVLDQIKAQKESTSRVQVTYRIRRPNGGYRWIHARTFPIQDTDGTVLRYGGTLEDVTREKEAEAALRESEERFRQFADQTQDCISLRDPETRRLIYMNSAFERIFGRPSGPYLQDPAGIREFVHPDDLSILDAAQTRQEQGVYDSDEEYRIVMPDGGVRWVRERDFPILDERGNVHMIGAIHTNITQLKSATEELRSFAEELEQRVEARTAEIRESEASLAEAQRIGHVGSWAWDISENHVEWSDEIFRQLGFSAADDTLTFASFMERVHPEDRDLVGGSFRAAVREGESFNIEFRILPLAGGFRFVHSHGEVQYDDAGEPVRMAGTIHDITERKRLEDRLLQAKKMESIGQLAGGIAHDFNNLMTVVGGYSEILAQDPGLSHDVKDKLNAIRNASARAGALTEKLLAYSRKLFLRPRIVDLNQMVGSILSQIEAQSDGRVEVVTNLTSNAVLTLVDPQQVREVLLSLTANSCEAMAEGGTLTVATSSDELSEADVRNRPEVKTGLYAVISVTDTGVGMDKKTLDSIFEPFFTTKDKSSGAGMGLASVYGIVKQSDGFIEVDSAPGTGTRVDVYLPAHQG